MNNENPKKLTAEDLPELANVDTSVEGTCCCYYKQTWTGWEKIRCTDEYSSEDACRGGTPSGADAYSWSPYSC